MAKQYTSVFTIPKMDCPAEERLIRMTLDPVQGVHALSFDLADRRLQVTHDEGLAGHILSRLEPLGLGAKLSATSEVSASEMAIPAGPNTDAQEAATLRLLLAINAVMFCVEMVTGWIAESTGLIADSLDMFADAAVYGIALYAVGRSAKLKLGAARMAGWLQLFLALGALAEVVRRFLFGSEPKPPLMMGIAFIALIANVSCLWLLARHREGGAHMKASWIFSANDVVVNSGVIVAGALVAWTHSRYPDLVIGTIVGLIVLNGARRILRLRG